MAPQSIYIRTAKHEHVLLFALHFERARSVCASVYEFACLALARELFEYYKFPEISGIHHVHLRNVLAVY